MFDYFSSTSAMLTVGARALAKHCHRDDSLQWWGKCSGSKPPLVSLRGFPGCWLAFWAKPRLLSLLVPFRARDVDYILVCAPGSPFYLLMRNLHGAVFA